MRRVLIWSIGLGVTALIGVWYQWPDGEEHVVACEVGQGDATLITLGFSQVLVDGGPANGKVLTCLGRHMPFWDRKIEMVMVSHTDADHYGGLVEVMRRYQVGAVVVTGLGEQLKFETNLARQIIAHQGQELKLGELTTRILWPPGEENVPTAKDNEASIVARLSYKTMDVLLTGDMDTKVEEMLIDEGVVLSGIEVLKASHHGSRSGNSEAWLKQVQPKVALIEVGQKNRYGHPHQEVLDRLHHLGVKVYRTDEEGDVEVVSDGKTYRVKD